MSYVASIFGFSENARAGCYRTAVAITPADNAAIGPFEAIYVGGGGDVTLIPANSTTPVLVKAGRERHGHDCFQPRRPGGLGDV
jgi:hypothetical protein